MVLMGLDLWAVDGLMVIVFHSWSWKQRVSAAGQHDIQR
jgi:hypothetical protein